MPDEAYQSFANKGKPYDDNDETLFGVHAQVSFFIPGFSPVASTSLFGVHAQVSLFFLIFELFRPWDHVHDHI